MNKKCAEHWRAGFVRPHLQIIDLAYADPVSESRRCLFNQSVFTNSPTTRSQWRPSQKTATIPQQTNKAHASCCHSAGNNRHNTCPLLDIPSHLPARAQARARVWPLDGGRRRWIDKEQKESEDGRRDMYVQGTWTGFHAAVSSVMNGGSSKHAAGARVTN